MTIQTASTKLIEATNKLNDARKAQSEMAVIVSAEQTGFERMVPLAAAVEQARRTEDWANTMLVKAITNR
jgi:hypothetical protein